MNPERLYNTSGDFEEQVITSGLRISEFRRGPLVPQPSPDWRLDFVQHFSLSKVEQPYTGCICAIFVISLGCN